MRFSCAVVYAGFIGVDGCCMPIVAEYFFQAAYNGTPRYSGVIAVVDGMVFVTELYAVIFILKPFANVFEFEGGFGTGKHFLEKSHSFLCVESLPLPVGIGSVLDVVNKCQGAEFFKVRMAYWASAVIRFKGAFADIAFLRAQWTLVEYGSFVFFGADKT